MNIYKFWYASISLLMMQGFMFFFFCFKFGRNEAQHIFYCHFEHIPSRRHTSVCTSSGKSYVISLQNFYMMVHMSQLVHTRRKPREGCYIDLYWLINKKDEFTRNRFKRYLRLGGIGTVPRISCAPQSIKYKINIDWRLNISRNT